MKLEKRPFCSYMTAISFNTSTKLFILGISIATHCDTATAFFPSKRFRYISSDTSDANRDESVMSI